jgi:hypothetical protein
MLDEFQSVSKIIEEAEIPKEGVKTATNEFRKERINTGRVRNQEQPNETMTADGMPPEKETGQKTPRDFYDEPENEHIPTDEKYHDGEPFDEKGREIRKRKEALKKSRNNEADYPNDYSKGK